MPRDADYWIERLELAEHPEGGYFRQVYKSREQVSGDCLSGRYGGPRSLSSCIYYLLKGSQFSALHRLKSDEIWHFHAGSPLTLFVIDRDGVLTRRKLGTDPDGGEAFHGVIKAGGWFGATVDDPRSYSLVGCTVAPGFEYDDFELGGRDELLRRYPLHADVIERLTH